MVDEFHSDFNFKRDREGANNSPFKAPCFFQKL